LEYVSLEWFENVYIALVKLALDIAVLRQPIKSFIPRGLER
jgi:hypothetical protein